MGTRRYEDRGRLLTSEEVREHIAHHVDCAYYSAKDFEWYYDDSFPVAKLRAMVDGTGPFNDSPSGWIAWLQRERRTEDGYRWDGDFVNWWSQFHPEEPIVVAEGTGRGGGFGIADGNHRTAVSHECGMKIIPAYVGYRK